MRSHWFGLICPKKLIDKVRGRRAPASGRGQLFWVHAVSSAQRPGSVNSQPLSLQPSPQSSRQRAATNRMCLFAADPHRFRTS